MAREAGLRFERFPIPDRGVPASVARARALWVDLADRLRAGRSVGIHCRAGIGRSSLMAAGVLLEIGVSEDPAWAADRGGARFSRAGHGGAAGVAESDPDSFAMMGILGSCGWASGSATRGPAPDQLIF
jgi:hypothetical protein